MTVQLASLSDVREFVGLATLQPYEVQVRDGDRRVDAKCFMEMFTLDFTAPLNVEISGEENKSAFASAAKKFLVCTVPSPKNRKTLREGPLLRR